MPTQTGYIGPEYHVSMYLVDGYCSDTRTIYEFDGCVSLRNKMHLSQKVGKETQEKLSTQVLVTIPQR